MDIATMATIAVAITSAASVFIYVTSRDKRLYFAIEQSTDIVDIEDDELKESIKIQLINNKGMSRTINNLYTTKLKIVNMGFSHIKNNDEQKYPIIVAFDDESEVISCKKEKNLENRGIKPVLHDAGKNIIKIYFTGFNRKESVYLEIICINGKSELPNINTPFKPLKTKIVRGYDEEEARLEKDIPKTFLIASLFPTLFSAIGFISIILGSSKDIYSTIVMFMMSLILIPWSILRVRKINLLTFPSRDEINFVKIEGPTKNVSSFF